MAPASRSTPLAVAQLGLQAAQRPLGQVGVEVGDHARRCGAGRRSASKALPPLKSTSTKCRWSGERRRGQRRRPGSAAARTCPAPVVPATRPWGPSRTRSTASTPSSDTPIGRGQVGSSPRRGPAGGDRRGRSARRGRAAGAGATIGGQAGAGRRRARGRRSGPGRGRARRAVGSETPHGEHVVEHQRRRGRGGAWRCRRRRATLDHGGARGGQAVLGRRRRRCRRPARPRPAAPSAPGPGGPR